MREDILKREDNFDKKLLFIIVMNIIMYWMVFPALLLFFTSFLFIGKPNFWLTIPGVSSIILGLLFSFWATGDLFFGGYGLPLKYSPTKRLVKDGMYSVCRHPLYLGFSLYLLGLFFLNVTSMGLIIYLIYLGVLAIIIIKEERELRERFGKNYDEYINNTPIFFPTGSYNSGVCPSLVWMFLFLAGKFVSTFVYRIKVIGRENIPDEDFLLISNHTNFFDPVFIICRLNKYIRFTASDHFYQRIHYIFKFTGSIPIKRWDTSANSILKLLRISKEGNIVGFFPEGTRIWDGRPYVPKEGIMKLMNMLKKPIVAVRINGGHLNQPRWKNGFNKTSMEIVVERIDDPEAAIDFSLSKKSYNPENIYPDYRGVENYIWACPKCGNLKFRSKKDSIFCPQCGFEDIKPNIEKVQQYHDSLPEKFKNGTLIDKAKRINIRGKDIIDKIYKFELNDEGLFINDEKIEVDLMMIDGYSDFYIYKDRKMKGFRFQKTKALMWKEMIEIKCNVKRNRYIFRDK
ncbi:MAG: hypothetical protein PWQ77_1749 [Kosmotogales bacterium]|nr:hypothetical protein [Kosmotogales bacterium]